MSLRLLPLLNVQPTEDILSPRYHLHLLIRSATQAWIFRVNKQSAKFYFFIHFTANCFFATSSLSRPYFMAAVRVDIEYLLLSLRKMLWISYDILSQNWTLSTFCLSVKTKVRILFDQSFVVLGLSSFWLLPTTCLNVLVDVIGIHHLQDLVFVLADHNHNQF